MGVPLNHPFEWEFPFFDEAFWGSSICGNPQVDIHLTEDPSFQEPILARKAGGAYLDANDRDSS